MRGAACEIRRSLRCSHRAEHTSFTFAGQLKNVRAIVCDLNPSLCALRSLAMEEATVASSDPAPPHQGLGAHCDQWAAIFRGKSDTVREGTPAHARPHVCTSLPCPRMRSSH